MTEITNPHKLKSIMDKFIDTFADCIDEGHTPTETLLGGLIYFIRLEVLSSDDIKKSVEDIQNIINASIAEAQEEVEGL